MANQNKQNPEDKLDQNLSQAYSVIMLLAQDFDEHNGFSFSNDISLNALWTIQTLVGNALDASNEISKNKSDKYRGGK